MALSLQKFISHNKENFRELLSQKPYCLIIREDGDLALFKYNQLESDFSSPIVRESRGIILYKSDWTIACHPFHKFFNYGETNADKIDWSSAKVMEKLDGSIIKLFFNKRINEWQWATNGTINALETPLGMGGDYTFGWLIAKALEESRNFHAGKFSTIKNSNYTYLFELCSPFNRVVVPHTETKLYFLSAKHNDTGAEILDDVFDGLFPLPKVYNLNSLDEIVSVAQNLPFNDEGYVVVDKFFNRIKVKSPAYVAVHHLANNGVISKKRIVELIMISEISEFLNYFPEYTEFTEEVTKGYNNLIQGFADSQGLVLKYIFENRDYTRKDLALFIKENIENKFIHGFLFGMVDGKNNDYKDYIVKAGSEKVANIL